MGRVVCENVGRIDGAVVGTVVTLALVDGATDGKVLGATVGATDSIVLGATVGTPVGA